MRLAQPSAWPTPRIPLQELRWIVQSTCPPDWCAQLERCEGGFFHSPPGLVVVAPPGEPMFAQLLSGQEVVGVAAGVRSRCRLSRRPRHYYFPTLPALGGPGQPDELLAALVSVLRSYGAGEVVFDSFDARWEPGIAALEPAARQEYFVPL